MPSIPAISIRQYPAKLGIDADLGKQSIEQPRATVEIQTEKPQTEIYSPRGDLEIDQTRAWEALGLGNIMESLQAIYREARNVGMEGIARRVEYGNRLARIQDGGNPIADHARELSFEFYEFNYVGEASIDNVDISYTAHKPEINVTEGKVHFNTQYNKPVVSYDRGKLDIYMMDYGRVEITPPQIDLRV